MEDLSLRIFNSYSLFFLFYAFHQFFSIWVLADHDVGDTQIGKNNGSHTEKIIHMLLDDRFIVSGCISKLVILHEECMSNV